MLLGMMSNKEHKKFIKIFKNRVQFNSYPKYTQSNKFY